MRFGDRFFVMVESLFRWKSEIVSEVFAKVSPRLIPFDVLA